MKLSELDLFLQELIDDQNGIIDKSSRYRHLNSSLIALWGKFWKINKQYWLAKVSVVLPADESELELPNDCMMVEDVSDEIGIYNIIGYFHQRRYDSPNLSVSLFGNKLLFKNKASADRNIDIIYLRRCKNLVFPYDVIDFYPGFENIIAWRAAISISIKFGIAADQLSTFRTESRKLEKELENNLPTSSRNPNMWEEYGLGGRKISYTNDMLF